VIGLPSLQAMDRAQGARIWMAGEATDMRCGFDRLAERVKTVIGENPQSGHLFVFRSRRGDRLKILVWDRDGFVLWYKRLEVGVFKLPRVEQGARAARQSLPTTLRTLIIYYYKSIIQLDAHRKSVQRRTCRPAAPE
jgi:transposase